MACIGGYHLDNQAVIDLFIDGLPQRLVRAIVEQEDPHMFEEWKDAAIRNHTKCKWLLVCFAMKRSNSNKSHPTQEQWKKAFQKPKDPNAMDTTPRRVKTHAALTQEDKAKLMAAGKCFQCKKQGHMSKTCPDKPAQARGTPDSDSEAKTIQAASSKLTKHTNPFLTSEKKKTMAQDIICLISNAEDDVKDTII